MKSQFRPSQFTLPKSQVLAIANAPPNFRDRVLIKALYWAGLRRFECTALNIVDVDFVKGALWVMHGKGDKLRFVPFLDDTFKSELRHLIGKRSEGPVFLNER